MKNVQKAPKIRTRGTAFRLVSDLTSHAQLKMFRPGQSRYPGWSVHMGKISSSVTEISLTGPARSTGLIWRGPEISGTELENFPIWTLQPGYRDCPWKNIFNCAWLVRSLKSRNAVPPEFWGAFWTFFISVTGIKFPAWTEDKIRPAYRAHMKGPSVAKTEIS